MVQPGHLVDLPDDFLRVVHGVAPDQSVALGVYIPFLVALRGEGEVQLIGPLRATDAPNLVVLSSILRTRIVSLRCNLGGQLPLLVGHDDLDGIQNGKIGVFPDSPPLSGDLKSGHLCQAIAIGPGHKLGECSDPVLQELSIGLGGYEAAVESNIEHVLGVGLVVVEPVKTLAVVRVEIHHHLWQCPVAVENRL